jgi:hypothetical protein
VRDAEQGVAVGELWHADCHNSSTRIGGEPCFGKDRLDVPPSRLQQNGLREREAQAAAQRPRWRQAAAKSPRLARQRAG